MPRINYVLARTRAKMIFFSMTHSMYSRCCCRDNFSKFAVQRRQMHPATVSSPIPDRNCRHRRPINITSVPPFAEALSASDRKAPIIIHSSLNRPPTRQLRLPVGQVYNMYLTTRFHDARVLRCVNVCSRIIVNLEKQHSQITRLKYTISRLRKMLTNSLRITPKCSLHQNLMKNCRYHIFTNKLFVDKNM